MVEILPTFDIPSTRNVEMRSCHQRPRWHVDT